MEPYYFGGYFLIKNKPFSFISIKNKIVQTCSSCINISAFNVDWCVSCTEDLDNEAKAELGLTDQKIVEIQKWTDQQFDEGTIKWGSIVLWKQI